MAVPQPSSDLLLQRGDPHGSFMLNIFLPTSCLHRLGCIEAIYVIIFCANESGLYRLANLYTHQFYLQRTK